MKKRRVHISKLNIRLPHGASANAKNIAGEIGRAILQNVGESVRGLDRNAAIDGISIDGIRISPKTAAEAGSKTAAAVKSELGKGGRG
jgi:hypothetical protein